MESLNGRQAHIEISASWMMGNNFIGYTAWILRELFWELPSVPFTRPILRISAWTALIAMFPIGISLLSLQSLRQMNKEALWSWAWWVLHLLLPDHAASKFVDGAFAL